MKQKFSFLIYFSIFSFFFAHPYLQLAPPLSKNISRLPSHRVVIVINSSLRIRKIESLLNAFLKSHGRISVLCHGVRSISTMMDLLEQCCMIQEI